AADECKIESAANGGAGEWNEPRDPFFRSFGADTNGEALHDDRSEFFDEPFFGEVFAEIDSGGSGGSEPEFALLLVSAQIETIEQAKPLNQAQRNDGEQAGVRNDGDHAAEAEAGSFKKREALRIANQNFGDSIQLVDRQIAQVAEVVDVDAVLLGKVAAEG